MKNILIIVFLAITTCGFFYSFGKFVIVNERSPKTYEVISSDGTRYTTKKGSFVRNSNIFKDSVRFETEDGSTVILTDGYSYKLLDLNSDEVKRWKKELLLYGLIMLGSSGAWVWATALFIDNEM